MSILGIGMTLLVVGAVTFIPAVIAGSYTGLFTWSLLPREAALAAGGVLTAIGLVFYANSAYLIITRFKLGKLIRSGVYRIVRNPMYSSFILFLAPGLSLILNNWLVLTTSVTIFIAFRLKIDREEIFLEKQFGEEYNDYRKTVKQIIPFFL